MNEFLKRKNIVFSAKRYGIDALGAMAQGLFCSLLIGTIVKTLGQQFSIPFLVDVGAYCSAMSGPAMACAIGYALQAPPLVLFSLATVGHAANALGGAGGPLAVLFMAIIAAECGNKAIIGYDAHTHSALRCDDDYERAVAILDKLHIERIDTL